MDVECSKSPPFKMYLLIRPIISMQLFFFALLSTDSWLWKRKELHLLHMTPVNVSTVIIANKLNEYFSCGHFKTNS